MNRLLTRQIEEAVGTIRDGRCSGLDCEAQLRIAAATLSDTPSGLITAITVVGLLGHDDAAAVETLVHEIAEEFGIQSHVGWHVGTFSVRFSCIDQQER